MQKVEKGSDFFNHIKHNIYIYIYVRLGQKGGGLGQKVKERKRQLQKVEKCGGFRLGKKGGGLGQKLVDLVKSW